MHACDQHHLLPEVEREREVWQEESDARNSIKGQQALSPSPLTSLSSSSLQISKQMDNKNTRESPHWWMSCKNTFAHVANKVGVVTHKVQNTFDIVEKENESELDVNRECENVSNLSLLGNMCKTCTNTSSSWEQKNNNQSCEQQIENFVGHDNEHALFDLMPISNDSNSHNIVDHAYVNTDIDIDNDDDDFNDSQMNDAFGYSSSEQSHYSNSTSSFHSSAAYSKRDNAIDCNASKANTILHNFTNVPSSINNNTSASLDESHFLTEKPLNIDEYNKIRPRPSLNKKQDVENNSVKNTRMYKKLNWVWQKCKKLSTQLVKKRPWTIKQNSRQGKCYLPFSSCRSDYNLNRRSELNCNCMIVKRNSEKQQEREELSNWEYSAWNMPIVPDALIYQLRSMVTLQIGQNADKTLHEKVEEVQEAFELETSTTTTFPKPIQYVKKVPTWSYKFKELNDVHYTNFFKNVHVNSTRDKLDVPTCISPTKQVACKSHKRVRSENDNVDNAELRLAKELLQLANILHNSRIQLCSQQERKWVNQYNEYFSERCNPNNVNTEEEACQEQENYKNFSTNDNDNNIGNNVMESTSANHSFAMPSKLVHTQHHTFGNHNTSKSFNNTKDKLVYALYHNLTHHSTSPSGSDTMHNNQLFGETHACNKNKFNTLATTKEKNEEHNLPKSHEIEQQFANEVYKHTKEECNEHITKNVQSLCVELNEDKHDKLRTESGDTKINSSCQVSICPLLNLISNDHDVAVRNVYDTLLTEFLQRAVQERVNCKLANLNDATERGLSESILRQTLAHFISYNSYNYNNRKRTMEKETSTNTQPSQEQIKTNLAKCFSGEQTNSSELVKTNTNYNTDKIDSVRFTGVVQHIRTGKPVMLQMLEFNQEDEEILNRVASLRHNNQDNAVSLSTPGYSMTYAQLGTLCASCWLSDQVINNYLQLLCESFRVSSDGQANVTGASTIASLGTHFYAKVQTELASLTGGNYDYTYDAETQSFCWNFPPLPEKSAILRWLRKRLELLRPYKPQRKVNINNSENEETSKYKFDEQNIAETIKWELSSSQHIHNVPLEENESVTCVRVVFIPVNIHDQHWALVVWNKETEQLIYYDSLGRRSGYYRRSCLGNSGNNYNQKYFMQNTGKATPTQAERILAELDHVLSECQRHLLCVNKTEKSSVFTDSFSQGSNNTFDSVNNRKCRDFVNLVGGSKQADIMPINKTVKATHSKLGVEHVIADSYTASLHDLSDYKPFRNLSDLQVAQEEFNSRTRKNDIWNKNKNDDNRYDNNRNYNYETSWTMSGEECNNDMSDMEIEWFAEGHLKVPRQSNGNDCGVFVCQVAWCVAHGVAVNFTQQDIHTLRNVMILELWCKRILRRLPSMITPSSCDVNLNSL